MGFLSGPPNGKSSIGDMTGIDASIPEMANSTAWQTLIQ